MIAHERKPENVNHIKRAEFSDQFEEHFFADIRERITVQGGSGHDMIDGGRVGFKKTGDAAHFGLRWKRFVRFGGNFIDM